MQRQLILTTTLFFAATSLALAKNTADDWKWKNTYYKSYGEWTTACEDRADDPNVKRCYLRYVDAYAREPFGAFFVFVTVTKEGPAFSFEFEQGTKFDSNWTVTAGEKAFWSFNPVNCPIFGECVLSGAEGTALAKTLAAPNAVMNFNFTDREGRVLKRRWPGDIQFADAFYDLQKQTADRSLD